jgi:hypothetical protein
MKFTLHSLIRGLNTSIESATTTLRAIARACREYSIELTLTKIDHATSCALAQRSFGDARVAGSSPAGQGNSASSFPTNHPSLGVS